MWLCASKPVNSTCPVVARYSSEPNVVPDSKNMFPDVEYRWLWEVDGDKINVDIEEK